MARTFLILLSALLLPLLFACSLQHFAEETAQPSISDVRCGDESDRTFWVINLGWHSGIVVRSEDLNEEMRKSLAPVSSLPYIEFGWGDKDFYMSTEYSWGKALHAALFSGGSVVHIAGFSESAFAEHIAGNEVVRVAAGEKQINSLLAFISSYIVHDQNGEIIRLGRSLYGEGFFVEACGRFSLLFTCNTWTAEAVHVAGCRSHSFEG